MKSANMLERLNQQIRRRMPVIRIHSNEASCLIFYFILKSLRAGFVLSKIPAGNLPYACILTAMFAGTVSTLVFRLSRRHTAITILTGIYIAIIASLLVLRWAMTRSIECLQYLYFVYVEIVAVLTTAQFWLLAVYVFDRRFNLGRVFGKDSCRWSVRVQLPGRWRESQRDHTCASSRRNRQRHRTTPPLPKQ